MAKYELTCVLKDLPRNIDEVKDTMNEWLESSGFSIDKATLKFLSLDECDKPFAPLVGADSHVYALAGIARQALREAGLGNLAKEMIERLEPTSDLDEGIRIIMEYVNIDVKNNLIRMLVDNKG